MKAAIRTRVCAHAKRMPTHAHTSKKRVPMRDNSAQQLSDSVIVCVRLWVDMPIDAWVDMRIYTWMDVCIDICITIDTCIDMCMNVCLDACA